jgi:hypothetical protein
MKKLRICLVLLIGLMIMGGTAWAWNSTDHVKAAPNAKGDLIIFPWYYTASGGYDTKMTVINTSSTYSTVAKLVIRSHNYSEELLDFLIYLSPNDVWTGSLKTGATGTYIYSEDDSMLRRLPAASGAVTDDFASVTNPVSNALYAVSCKDDSTSYGYVEVIEASATTGLTKITGTNKVAKTTIYNWYAALPDSPIPQTRNILTAYQEFLNASAGIAALNRAEIFADWNNTNKLDVALVTGLTSPARNTIGELEAAMAKSSVALPYLDADNGDYAIHIFNFPTKLSWEESTCAVYNAFNGSPYFVNLGQTVKCEDYTPDVYDLMENTPTSTGSPFSGGDPGTKPQMCEEVTLVSTVFADALFKEGWIRYNWATTAASKGFSTKSGSPLTNDFTGTPVLPVVLYLKAAAMSQAGAAFDNGVVTEGGVILPYFQYSQYTTP